MTRIERWARHPAGNVLLALFAALEASIFPAPTEALMVALSVARPRRSWHLGVIAVLGSMLGAGVGYALGRYGQGNLEWALGGFVGTERLETLGRGYRAGAFWLLVTSGFTPIPYLFYTVAGGVYRVPLLPFLAGALLGRALKYFLLGTVTYILAPFVRRAWARPGLLTSAIILALIIALLIVLLR